MAQGAPTNSPVASASNADAKKEDGGAVPADQSPDKRKERKRRLGVDPSLIISEGRSKRRRTPTPPPKVEKPDPDPRDPERAKGLGMQLYDKIIGMHDAE